MAGRHIHVPYSQNRVYRRDARQQVGGGETERPGRDRGPVHVREHGALEGLIAAAGDEEIVRDQDRADRRQRGVGLIVNGFCKEVLQQLPMEFAVEAQKLVGISLEGSVG